MTIADLCPHEAKMWPGLPFDLGNCKCSPDSDRCGRKEMRLFRTSEEGHVVFAWAFRIAWVIMIDWVSGNYSRQRSKQSLFMLCFRRLIYILGTKGNWAKGEVAVCQLVYHREGRWVFLHWCVKRRRCKKRTSVNAKRNTGRPRPNQLYNSIHNSSFFRLARVITSLFMYHYPNAINAVWVWLSCCCCSKSKNQTYLTICTHIYVSLPHRFMHQYISDI
jgi:hypothetical protein